jgi:hypothetical protein
LEKKSIVCRILELNGSRYKFALYIKASCHIGVGENSQMEKGKKASDFLEG